MTTEHDLGAVLGRYESDNRRRRRFAYVAIPGGALVALLGVLMFLPLAAADAGAAVIFPSFVIGGGLSAVLLGVVQARLSVTRAGEAFTLYESGLVHSYRGQAWAISWAEIAEVRNLGRDTAFSRALRSDIQYRVTLRSPVAGRRTLTITGFTDRAVELAEIVQQAVPCRNGI